MKRPPFTRRTAATEVRTWGTGMAPSYTKPLAELPCSDCGRGGCLIAFPHDRDGRLAIDLHSLRGGSAPPDPPAVPVLSD